MSARTVVAPCRTWDCCRAVHDRSRVAFGKPLGIFDLRSRTYPLVQINDDAKVVLVPAINGPRVRANETTTALPEPLIGIAHVSRFTGQVVGMTTSCLFSKLFSMAAVGQSRRHDHQTTADHALMRELVIAGPVMHRGASSV